MKKIKCLIFTCTLIYGTFGVTQSSRAAIFFTSDFEGKTCDSVIADGERADDAASRAWDIYYENPLTGVQYEPHVRCSGSITAPSGSKYVEWLASSQTSGTAVELPWSTPINLVMGRTYYLGGFFRFDRINGVDVWHDTPTGSDGPDSFDKLFEFGGAGTGSNTRWGISSGWASGIYRFGSDHQFAFDPWCADSAFTECQNSQTYDHKTANVPPYGTNNPYLANYGRWNSVVLAVTLQTTVAGNAKLWVNGVLTHDGNFATTGPSPQLNRMFINGTVGQPAYDAPLHYRRMDRLMLTDSLADITAAGLMSDPTSGTSPTPTPTPTPPPDTQAPTPPGSLSATVVSPTQVNLAWGSSTDNVGITGYRLERCTGAGCTAFTQIATPGSTSFQNTTVVPTATYQYRVRATDAAGNLSGYSNLVSATAPSAPTPTPTPTPTATPTPPPGSVTVTLGSTGDATLNIDDIIQGALTTLSIYTYPAQRIANAILMKFNLGSIPSNATISSATLNLTYTGSDPGDTDPQSTTYTISAHKVINRNPNLSLATGATYDGVNAWTTPSATILQTCCDGGFSLAQGDIGPAFTSTAVTKAPGASYTWNLTSLVQDWVTNPTLNYGLLLNSDPTKGADRSRYFASSEHGTVSSRPSLIVTYTTSGGDTVAPGVPGNVRVL